MKDDSLNPIENSVNKAEMILLIIFWFERSEVIFHSYDVGCKIHQIFSLQNWKELRTWERDPWGKLHVEKKSADFFHSTCVTSLKTFPNTKMYLRKSYKGKNNCFLSNYLAAFHQDRFSFVIWKFTLTFFFIFCSLLELCSQLRKDYDLLLFNYYIQGIENRA